MLDAIGASNEAKGIVVFRDDKYVKEYASENGMKQKNAKE